MAQSWKKLEDQVRAIASLRWNAPCRPEHIDGVDFDGVVRLPDEIILIEVTEESNLGKVRDDLNKILPIRMSLLMSGVVCRAYIVMSQEPTNSMKEVGVKQHIQVLSVTDFERAFFDFASYYRLRVDQQFGSAIDSKTGKNDPHSFVQVRY
ncbi:hypothetical protein, partial [Xanthomonas citri]